MKTKTRGIVFLILIAIGGIGCSSSSKVCNEPGRERRYSDYDVALTPLYFMVEVYETHKRVSELYDEMSKPSVITP